MIRDITLGQYLPFNSILHRLDSRIKLIIMFIMIAEIFFTLNYIVLTIITLFSFIIIMLSKVPVKIYLKSLKMIFIVIIFTAGLNLFYGNGPPIFEFGIIKITEAGINSSIFVSVRLISLVIVSSALTFTTLPTDLTDAFERIMKPLKFFKINVSEIAMMMTIALRFVPTLLEETDKIMNAQKSRGADIESGGLIQRIKALVPILVPLFVSSFRRAYDLAMAMECRCYQSGNIRTRMKVLKIKKIDIYALGLVLVLCIVLISLNIFLPQVSM